MLILPIVNRNRILNVEVKLKTAEKIRSGARLFDTSESDVIINGKKMSDSCFESDRHDDATLKFIRANSIRFKRNFFVTTRQEANSTCYDVYEIEHPPKKINDGLDNLYTSVITDMRKEIPGVKRGRYVSLEKLGVGTHLTDEKIAKLKAVVKDVDPKQWPQIFEQEGLMDLVETLEFIKLFDCTVVEDSTISEDSLKDIISSLNKLNTRETRNLASYYNMALTNRDIYSKLSNVNKTIYDKPLVLIQSKSQKEKRLVKTIGETINGKSA